jgi:RecA/RadA recombinase
MAALVDAEFATGREFASELMGDLEQRPNLMSVRPRTYEETVDNVDRFLKWVVETKKDQPYIRSICVVDSINKLVPARELERILKDQGGGEEMAKGHWGRQRAAMNQAWLDHLVPLLAAADCALVLVAQERDEAPDSPFSKQDDWKVKGGAALLFDASLLVRVTKMKPLYDGEEKPENIIGFRHRMRIYKSKVGHMDGRDSNAIFHLSNGKFSPPGFDTARDALMVGRAVDVVGVAGSWITWRKHKWQGENRAVAFLSQNPDVLNQLLDDVNTAVDKDAGRNAS